MADTASYRQFIEVVRDLCEEGRSGTLFIRTSDNHAAMIFFDRGDITGAYHRAFKGRKALALLRVADSLTCRFDDGQPPTVSQDLRATDQTLAELAAGSVDESSELTTPTLEPTLPEGAPATQLGLDSVIGGILARELASYIGPAAQRVAMDAQRGVLALATRDEIRQTVGKLAGDFLEPEEHAEFEDAAIDQIHKLFTSDALDAIRGALVESLGPMGPTVLDQALLDSGTDVTQPQDLERLLGSLMRSVDTPGEARAFVARVRAALDSMTS